MNDSYELKNLLGTDGSIKIEILDENTKNTPDILDNDNMNTVFKYMNAQNTNEQQRWSRSAENTINKYVKKSIGYKKLYYETHFTYSFYHKIMITLLILANCFAIGFQSISSTLIITGDGATNTTSSSTRTQVLGIITASATAAVAIITFIYAQTRFDTYAVGCKNAAITFSDFADDLKTLLSIPRRYRSDPYQVINTVQSDYKRILKSNTEYEIPHYIYKKFLKDKNNRQYIIDINDAEEYDMYSGGIEQNIILNRFLTGLRELRVNAQNDDVYEDHENNNENNNGHKRKKKHRISYTETESDNEIESESDGTESEEIKKSYRKKRNKLVKTPKTPKTPKTSKGSITDRSIKNKTDNIMFKKDLSDDDMPNISPSITNIIPQSLVLSHGSKPDKTDKTDKTDKADKVEKSDKADKPDNSDQLDKVSGKRDRANSEPPTPSKLKKTNSTPK